MNEGFQANLSQKTYLRVIIQGPNFNHAIKYRLPTPYDVLNYDEFTFWETLKILSYGEANNAIF